MVFGRYRKSSAERFANGFETVASGDHWLQQLDTQGLVDRYHREAVIYSYGDIKQRDGLSYLPRYRANLETQKGTHLQLDSSYSAGLAGDQSHIRTGPFARRSLS